MSTLHLYAQVSHHQEAWVVGTPEALTALRDALTRALEDGRPAVAHSCAQDGEGYAVLVLPQTEREMSELFLPYTNPFGARPGEELPKLPGKHPYEAIEPVVYEALVTSD